MTTKTCNKCGNPCKHYGLKVAKLCRSCYNKKRYIEKTKLEECQICKNIRKINKYVQKPNMCCLL